MHRRTVLKLAGAGSLAAVAGCLSVSGSEDEGEPSSSNLTVEEVENLEVEQTDERTIEVDGTGAVETEPDMATLSVSIEAYDRDSARAVVEELAQRSDQLMDDLADADFSEDEVTTANYSLRESSRRNRYEGEHRYTLEIDDPDAVGETIDSVADSEADEIRSINFTLTEERREELYDDAVERAVEGAREETQLYATAAGVSVGDPVSIETADTNVSPFSRSFNLEAAAMADDAVATDIQAGDVTVSAHVTIEYEFHPEDE